MVSAKRPSATAFATLSLAICDMPPIYSEFEQMLPMDDEKTKEMPFPAFQTLSCGAQVITVARVVGTVNKKISKWPIGNNRLFWYAWKLKWLNQTKSSIP